MQSKKFKAIITTYKSIIIVSFTKSKLQLPAYSFDLLDKTQKSETKISRWSQGTQLYPLKRNLKKWQGGHL